jgi:hypothetical protein
MATRQPEPNENYFLQKQIERKIFDEEVASFQFQISAMFDLALLLTSNVELGKTWRTLQEIGDIINMVMALYKNPSPYMAAGDFLAWQLNEKIHPEYFSSLVRSISNQSINLKVIIKAALNEGKDVFDYLSLRNYNKNRYYTYKKFVINRKLTVIKEDFEKLRKLLLICEKTLKFQGGKYESLQLIIANASKIFGRVEEFMEDLERDVTTFNHLADKRIDPAFRRKVEDGEISIVRPRPGSNMRAGTKGKNDPGKPGITSITPSGGPTRRPVWSRIGFKKMRGWASPFNEVF